MTSPTGTPAGASVPTGIEDFDTTAASPDFDDLSPHDYYASALRETT